MPAPFGPSPKVNEYCEWAEKEAGCTVVYCVFDLKSYARITPPNGRAVHVPNKPSNEPLCHAEVANLDRRLGVESPFPKTPDPPE